MCIVAYAVGRGLTRPILVTQKDRPATVEVINAKPDVNRKTEIKMTEKCGSAFTTTGMVTARERTAKKRSPAEKTTHPEADSRLTAW